MEDVIKVGLDTGTVFQEFVLVAGELEAFLALFVADKGDVGQVYAVGGLDYADRHSCEGWGV